LTKGFLTYLRMPTVKGAHPDRKGEIEVFFPWFKLKVLNGHLPKLQMTEIDFFPGISFSLYDGLFGSVNGQDMSLSDQMGHGPCSRPWTTADFQHSHSRPQWQGFDNRFQSG
jgi:hypothetical protein